MPPYMDVGYFSGVAETNPGYSPHTFKKARSTVTTKTVESLHGFGNLPKKPKPKQVGGRFRILIDRDK